MTPARPIRTPRVRQRLILAGGGHAHIGVLRNLARRPAPGLKTQLVTPEPWLAYSGMLPAWVAGHYPDSALHIDLQALAAAAGVEFIAEAVVGLDPDRGHVTLASGRRLGYDRLSLDIGSTADPLARAGRHVIPVKPIERLQDGITVFEQDFAHRTMTARVAVIGGGAGGVELALSLAYRFRDWPCPPQVQLISRGSSLLGQSAGSADRRLRAALARAGITLSLGVGVVDIVNGDLRCADGRRQAADVVFLATGARAPGWLAETGLALDTNGFVAVDWHLRSASHPDVFAAGDLAALPEPRPKSGVFAVRQGPVLSANLCREADTTSLRALSRSPAALALISLGARRAIAWRSGWSLPASRLVWWLKHMIDRRFVRRFNPPYR